MGLFDLFFIQGEKATQRVTQQVPTTSTGQQYVTPSAQPVTVPRESRPAQDEEARVQAIQTKRQSELQSGGYLFGGIYSGASSLADKMATLIPSASAIERGVQRTVPETLQPAMTQFALFGRGVASAPGETIRFGGQAVLGGEYIARHPAEAASVALPAAGYAATGTARFARENPAEFIGLTTGTILLTYGIEKGIPKIYSGLQPRISEAGVLARTSPKEWGAVHASFNLFQDVYGIESRMKMAPDLGKVGAIGPMKGPAMERVISGYTHSIFGRATEIGQMPPEWAGPRGYTYDLDIFAMREAALKSEATRVIGPKSEFMDIHPFPEKYPIGVAEGGEQYMMQAAVNPLPKSKADLLFSQSGLVQEKLYIQAGRKMTSVIGEPESMTRWKFGPPLHRLKDVYDAMRETSYLRGELQAQIASSSPLNLPVQTVGRFKSWRMGRSLETMQTYFGAPENVRGFKEANIYQPLIRDFPTQGGIPPVASGGRRIGEPMFRPPRGYQFPTERSAAPSKFPVASPSVARMPSPSFRGSTSPSLSGSPAVRSFSSSPIARMSRSPSGMSTSPSRSLSRGSSSPSISPSRSPSFTPSRSPSVSPPSSPSGFSSPSVSPPSPSVSISGSPSGSPSFLSRLTIMPIQPSPQPMPNLPRVSAVKEFPWGERHLMGMQKFPSVGAFQWKLKNPVPTVSYIFGGKGSSFRSLKL